MQEGTQQNRSAVVGPPKNQQRPREVRGGSGRRGLQTMPGPGGGEPRPGPPGCEEASWTHNSCLSRPEPPSQLVSFSETTKQGGPGLDTPCRSSLSLPDSQREQPPPEGHRETSRLGRCKTPCLGFKSAHASQFASPQAPGMAALRASPTLLRAAAGPPPSVLQVGGVEGGWADALAADSGAALSLVG